MSLLRMYRGITVPAREFERVCENIRANGLQPDSQRRWQMETSDLRPKIEQFLAMKDLTTDHTRPSRKIEHDRGWHLELIDAQPAICACGDELGATYYAIRHNVTSENDTPVLIAFDAKVEELHVDGRDFLYNFVFQFGGTPGQRKAAGQIFGSALERYLDLAWQSDDMSYRIALCDLAVQDLEVVRAHHANSIVLGGRYGTTFCSAFLVRLPVSPERIVSVGSPKPVAMVPEMTSERFRQLQ